MSNLEALLAPHARGLPPSQIRQVYDRRRPSSINLGLGQPTLPVPAEILDEGIRRLRQGPMGYTANAGRPELCALIAAHHALPGRDSADNVIVTCGAQEAVFATMLACLGAGDEVLIPDPVFPSYAMVARFCQARTVRVARRAELGFRLDAQAVIDAVTERTRLIVLNSPCNPTGAIDLLPELERLAELAEQRDLLLLSDEIYADINHSGAAVPSVAALTDRALLISGLSKNCAMTGFRLGYVVGATEILTGVLRAHHMASTCAPVLSQHMAEVAFENPSWLRRHAAEYTARRGPALDILRRHLDAPVIEPEGSFYVMVDLSGHTDDSLQLALDLLEHTDVVTAPGSAFGATTRGWLRLNFAVETAQFEEGVRRIADYLDGCG